MIAPAWAVAWAMAAAPLVVPAAVPGHVEPQISEAPAGARTTFAFLVEHGCDGSPTTQVSIQVPDGAFDVVPVAPVGWTAAVEEVEPKVVTFTGGPLADDAQESFGMELVTPNRPGEDVYFPTVQTCEAGEIGWIDTTDGAEEPAPRIRLTENPEPILPTSSTTTTESTATTDGSVTTEAAAPDPDADDDGGGDGGAALPLLGGLVVAGALAFGAAYAARRRPDR